MQMKNTYIITKLHRLNTMSYFFSRREVGEAGAELRALWGGRRVDRRKLRLKCGRQRRPRGPGQRREMGGEVLTAAAAELTAAAAA